MGQLKRERLWRDQLEGTGSAARASALGAAASDSSAKVSAPDTLRQVPDVNMMASSNQP